MKLLNMNDIIKITNRDIKELIMTQRLNAKTAKKLRKLAAIKAIENGLIVSHTEYKEMTAEKPNAWTTGPIRVGDNCMKFYYKELKKFHKNKR